jgi:ketosteroid isomerase-like protein
MPENPGSSHVPGPREVFERLINGIASGAWHDLADLYAPDVVVELPLALPSPMRIEGQEEIRGHFTSRPGLMTLRPRDIVVHETADPEVIVAEFAYDGQVTASGRRFTGSNVQVLRVRDGRIVASRDYHDHFRMNQAFDRLPELLASASDER